MTGPSSCPWPTKPQISRRSRGCSSPCWTSYLRGFRADYEAGHEIVIEMDGGLSHDPRARPMFLRSIKTLSYHIGQRLKGKPLRSRRFCHDQKNIAEQLPSAPNICVTFIQTVCPLEPRGKLSSIQVEEAMPRKVGWLHNAQAEQVAIVMRRWTAVALTVGIVGLLTAMSAHFFFHEEYYEFWDAAANSLSILRAKHFAQLYGPYSRWQFYHPGPAYFYVDALGEWLFHDLLHVVPTPYNGQILIHLCLMTSLFVAGLAVFMHWIPSGRRWTFGCAALTLAILHFSTTGRLPSWVDPLGGPTAFMSNWSAHFLVLPFFCLLTAGTSVAAGRGSDLPLLVIAGGLLVHAHVAQPIFVVPVALLAYAGLVIHAVRRRASGASASVPVKQERGWRLSLAAWREAPRAHWLAGAWLAMFLLPLIVDARQGHDSNLAAILRHLRTQSDLHKSLLRSVVYFLQFAAYSPYQPDRVDFGRYTVSGLSSYLRAHWLLYLGWFVVLVLLARALLDGLLTFGRRQTPATGQVGLLTANSPERESAAARLFLANGAVFTLLATALSLYWGTRQEGAMYYYNSWFNFGLLYFAALVAMAVLCSRRWPMPTAWRIPAGMLPSGWTQWTSRAAGAGTVILAGYLSAPRLTIHDQYGVDGNRGMHASIKRALAFSNAAHPGAYKMVTMPVKAWAEGVVVVLQLARAGEPFAVPQDWEVTFGKNHGWGALRQQDLSKGVCPWYIMPPGDSRPGVAADGPTFPLRDEVSLTFTPPALNLATVGQSAEWDFGPQGNASSYLLDGWSESEPTGRWSKQARALLCFRPQPVNGSAVEVSLTVLPFVAPLAPGPIHRQRMAVFFNGVPLGAPLELTWLGTVKLTIPAVRWNAAATGSDPLGALEFAFPDAVSPASLDPTGRNLDTRRLGVHFYKAQLRVVP